MKGVLKAMGFAAATLLATGISFADDASLRAELADTKALAANMVAQDSCNTCESEGGELVSMKGNAKIQIGGALYIDLVMASRDGTTGDVDTTRFSMPSDPLHTAESRLDFKINTKDPKSYVFIALDLAEWDANPAAGAQLVDQAYFAWEDINCSKLDIVFGKADTAYGLDKYVGIMAGIQDGGLYVADGQYDGVGTSAATQELLPTGATSVYKIGVAYDLDWAVWTFDLFQNDPTPGPDGDSEDDLFFESWATTLTFNPTESLMVKGSFQILEDEDTNDTAGPGADNNEANSKSISLAAVYKTCDWEFWAEYQHGWDSAFDDGADYDGISVGAMYNLSEQWALYALAEYGELNGLNDATNNNNAATDEEYTQFQLGAIRTLDSGITMTVEYAHQEVETRTAAATTDQDGDSFGIRFGYSW